jgi:hypothetical protein
VPRPVSQRGGANPALAKGLSRAVVDPRLSLAMQLVALFQASPDPFTAAAQFVFALGVSGSAYASLGGALPSFALAAPALPDKRSRAPPVAGDQGNWACNCGNVNFAFRTQCNKCEAPKPESR